MTAGKSSRQAEEYRLRDLDMVRSCLRGEKGAIAILIERLHCVPRTLAAINGRMGRPFHDHDLADLSQETLIQIWKGLSGFEGRARLETWARRISVFQFMQMFRRRKRIPAPVGDHLEKVLPPGSEGMGCAFKYERLEKSLQDLGAPEEIVIRLKHFEGRTFEEIGERLRMSPNTAKTRYYRGIDWLRRRLEPSRKDRLL